MYVVGNVAVNAQLYHNALKDVVHTLSSQGEETPQPTLSHSAVFSWIKETNKKFKKDRDIENMIESVAMLGNASNEDFAWVITTSRWLEENLWSYEFEFNTLSPSDRIIIPKININAPLNQSSFTKHINEITLQDFDKDLYEGVVQYPTTPHAGKYWNTLLFGHTSYESWKNNPYATIFSQITKLEDGDVVEIIQDGVLHKYKIFEKTIINPDQVNAEYLKHQEGNFISLLGCYPIGSDKQRILIVGELIE